MKFAGKLLIAALAATMLAVIIYVKAKNPKTIKTNKERKR